MKILYAVTFMLLATGCSAATMENGKSTVTSQVINQLNNLAAHDEPGIQYVVVDRNSTIFNRSVGLMSVSEAMPLKGDHTMASFSMTKTITAIAILQLVDQEKIQLDEKVSKYVEHPYDSNIMVRQLVNHTSGIPNPIPLKWVHLAETHDKFDESEELEKILEKYSELDSKPGKEYQYSNIGYWLLGGIIEKVSGLKFSDYVEKNVFQPLGLTSSEIGFQVEDTDNHAHGYLKKWSFMGLMGRFFVDSNILGENEKGWIRIKDVYLNGPSFGGAIGNAKSFSKILRDLLSDESKVLSASGKMLLYEQQVLNPGKQIDMTLGWHIGDLDGTRYFYKEGGGAGFHGEMRVYPDRGLGSVILTNKTSFNSRSILSDLDRNFVSSR